MVNMLISSKNLFNIKALLNTVLCNNKNVRISRLATNEIETIQALNSEDIDVIWLDMNASKLDILDKLDAKKQQKYEDSIIVVSKGFKDIENAINNKMIFDYIIKGSSINEAIYKVNRIIEYKDLEKKRRRIIKELKYIGYNIEYVGTTYLIEAILQMYKNRELMLDNLQHDIYPIISKKFNKPIHNIKCNITRATDCMYFECDIERLKEYFGFYEDDKPTPKTVIFTILNKI